jgi:hypothetical protein
MTARSIHKTLNYIIAIVWIANGLFCKVLNLVPRHQEIVSRILGAEHAILFTKIIGTLEVLMAIWILTRIYSKLNAITQILVIATMNTLEFFLVPDILLWGKLNSIFAFLFCILIFYNEFILNKKNV